jgi:dienelactone hydrolase
MLRRVLAAVLVLATLPACSAPDERPVITVDSAVALADQRVRIRVTGLAAGSAVTVRSEATDRVDRVWRGEAVVRADRTGTADLDAAASTGGTYRGTDGMGLFWSMAPEGGDADRSSLRPRPPELGPTQVRLTVTAASGATATATAERRWMAPGVVHQPVNADGLSAALYLPPPGGPVRRPVLIFGGSEGGNSQKWAAALLASHGHPAMSLGYFDMPGLPATLNNIPLEYFATAARHLSSRAGGGPVSVIGYSRGSEAAMLTGQYFPELVRGVVVYAPADVVNVGWPDFTEPAWTHQGVPLPQSRLQLDRIPGRVLAIAGGADQLWDSAGPAQRLRERRADTTVLTYSGAGHLVGTYPYQPTGVEDGGLRMGGSRSADHAARVDGWPQVLALLAAP